MDMYSQADFLQHGLLGASYYAFQGRYAITQKRTMGAHAFQQVVGYRNLEELSDRIAKFAFRAKKEDCLDLPEKTFTARYVALSPEQYSYYQQIRENALLMLEDDMVTTPQVITQMLRLQQVLCGHVATDEGELIEIPSQRAQAVLDILDETDGKVIIWARFRYDVETLTRKLNEVYGEGTGYKQR